MRVRASRLRSFAGSQRCKPTNSNAWRSAAAAAERRQGQRASEERAQQQKMRPGCETADARLDPRDAEGSPADRIITCTSRRLRRHGSIRSSDGSLSLPESGSSAVFTPPSSSWKLTSAPSSIATTKIPGPSNGPSPPTKSSPRSSASVTTYGIPYAMNFRFT
jgi:hypothetical protein